MGTAIDEELEDIFNHHGNGNIKTNNNEPKVQIES